MRIKENVLHQVTVIKHIKIDTTSTSSDNDSDNSDKSSTKKYS